MAYSHQDLQAKSPSLHQCPESAPSLTRLTCGQNMTLDARDPFQTDDGCYTFVQAHGQYCRNRGSTRTDIFPASSSPSSRCRYYFVTWAPGGLSGVNKNCHALTISTPLSILCHALRSSNSICPQWRCRRSFAVLLRCWVVLGAPFLRLSFTVGKPGILSHSILTTK